jgi:hypothetical protein
VEEQRWDGEKRLTSSPTVHDVNGALVDPANRYVALHSENSVVTLRSGTRYRVAADGSWRRLAP